MKAKSAVIIILLAVLTMACTRKVYVPVENTTVRTDTVYEAQIRVDSVFYRDSVAVIQRGDTVYQTRYRDRFRYRERTDTVYQSLVDSVKVSVPYTVERKLTKWEQTKQDYGGTAMALTFIALCIAVAWLIKRYR